MKCGLYSTDVVTPDHIKLFSKHYNYHKIVEYMRLTRQNQTWLLISDAQNHLEM